MKVNGITYTFEYISTEDMKMKQDETTLGYVDYHENKIYIKDELSDEVKRKTRIHELTHVIRFEYGYPRGKYEEEICDFIAAQYDELTRLINE